LPVTLGVYDLKEVSFVVKLKRFRMTWNNS